MAIRVIAATNTSGSTIVMAPEDVLYIASGVTYATTPPVNGIPAFQDHGVSAVDPSTRFSVICDGTLAGSMAITLRGVGGDVVVGATGQLLGAAFGIHADNANGNGLVFNGGLIYGTTAGLFGNFAEIHNTGTIRAGFSTFGIQNFNGAVINLNKTSALFENSGLVQAMKAGGAAYQSAGLSADTVINTGTMIGNVLLGAGNDKLDTSGGIIKGTINGEAGNDAITGSAVANTLFGGADNDTLSGGAGNDLINGGAGADVMYGGAGIDTLSYSGSAIGVNLNLATGAASGGDAAGDVFSGFENVTGSNGANRLTGSTISNTINGGAGNDTIAGGLGNDILVGGPGSDYFVFNTAANTTTNRDVITDYDMVHDVIQLENSGAGLFNALPVGFLNAAFLKQNAQGVATDANDRIVYNTTTGDLWYDANGNAAGGAVRFANLASHPSLLLAADFLVV